MPNENGWPDANKPGMPLNPERDGWHWVQPEGGEMFPAWWQIAGECERGRWPTGWIVGEFDHDPENCAYLGPCLTPAEVAHRERTAAAAAWLDAMEMAKVRVRAWWPLNGERIAADLATLSPPADAAAALAEVVRKAKEEALEEAAKEVERLRGHNEATSRNATLEFAAAAIRARKGGE